MIPGTAPALSLRGLGGGGERGRWWESQFEMRIKWYLLVSTSGPWCLFSASPPSCLFMLDNTSHALQSEEMTLPSLQRLCLGALVPVWKLYPINWDQLGTLCPGKPAAAPHHPAIPFGTLNLAVPIGKAE